MYTLILLFTLAAANPAGGVALNSQQVGGTFNEVECEVAAKKAIDDLRYKLYEQFDREVTVKASCIKIK